MADVIVGVASSGDENSFDIGNMTTKQFLEEVRKAIYSILVAGQSYKIGSRSLTRANLTELYNIEKDLQAQLAQNNSPLLDDCYVAIFDGR